MKKLFIVTIAATTLGFGLPVHAAGEHAHHDHAHMSHGGENMSMQGEGTIKRLSGGKVTLKHGPIGTEMPPMTMEFSVSDASLLEGLEKGDEVTFTMTKGMVITEISPTALSQAGHSADARWYTWDDVVKGGKVFANQCASCHGVKAEGKAPAPALNETAHAWHHSFSQLKQTIKKGTQRLGGSMPPFEDKLNDQEINQALAWVQSHWSDEVYSLWLKNTGGRK